MTQSTPSQSDLLKRAESVVPDEVLQAFRQRLAQRRNYLHIVEQLWFRFKYSTNENLALLFQNRTDKEISTEFIKTRTMEALPDYNQRSHGACLKELRRRMTQSEWENFFPAALRHLNLYNSIDLLKMVSSSEDGKNDQIVDVLFSAYDATDNGHLLNPIAETILSFGDATIAKRLSDVTNQRCKSGSLDHGSWGVQNVFEKLEAAKSKS
jgi:hypothetical protein